VYVCVCVCVCVCVSVSVHGSSLNAMRQIYKHNVIPILYKRIWCISTLCSLFSKWPAGSRVNVLFCELNGQASHPALEFFSVTFYFQLSYCFFGGCLGLIGLGFSIRVSVKF